MYAAGVKVKGAGPAFAVSGRFSINRQGMAQGFGPVMIKVVKNGELVDP